MKKLELKHLSAYLPYGLKGMSKNETVFLLSTYPTMGGGIENRTIETFLNDGYKPILRPLSDLTKEIEHNGEKFVPIFEIGKLLGFDYLTPIEIDENEIQYGWDSIGMDDSQGYVFGYSNQLKTFGVWYDEQEGNPIYLSGGYDEIQKLLEWHFDIFGLIEAGLAIDINTLEK
jgi:hypothetical protein